MTDYGHSSSRPSPSPSEPPAAHRDSGDVNRRIGPYMLVQEIGRGGFSRVYRGFRVDRPEHAVAVKVFEARWIDNIERLEIEKLVLQELQHPHLVSAIDSGQIDDGTTYLVMNLVEGVRIDHYVRDHELSYVQVAQMFARIAEALEYSHQRDVLHRDIKPNNILVTREDFPVVTDFGLAKRLNLVEGESLTATGAMIGTLGYLAPEQADSGRREVTRAADIYGLGATLYSVLTGQAPYKRDNLVQALDELINHQPASPGSFDPGIPKDLQMVCMKCLEKLPADRYPSMQHVADDLHRFVDGIPVVARPLSRYQSLRRWCRANPLVASLSFGLGAVIVAALLVTLILWRVASHRQQQAARLLVSAQDILQYGDQAADQFLMQTSGALHYRYERLKRSVSFFDDLCDLDPQNLELMREAATSYFRLGKASSRLGYWDDMRAAYETALVRFRNLSERQPDDRTLRFDVFHALLGMDGTLSIGPAPAERHNDYLLEAFDIIQELVDLEPENAYYRDALACTAMMLGQRLPANQLDRRFELTELAWQQATQLKKQHPCPCLLWRHTGTSAQRFCELYLATGDLAQAEHWLNVSLDETAAFLVRPDLDPGELLDWAGCLSMAIYLKRAQGDQQAASHYANELLQFLEKCVGEYPDFYHFHEQLQHARRIGTDDSGGPRELNSAAVGLD